MGTKDYLFHHNSINRSKNNQRICLIWRNQEEIMTITMSTLTLLMSNNSHKIKEITLMYLKIIRNMAV